MIRFQTEHLFAAPPEVVWPHVRQTDWVNRAVGLPEVKYTITPRPEGGSDVMAEARIAGRLARWKEYPFEWIEPEFYRVRRVYEGGVMAEALLGLDLERAGTGTHVTAYAELEPKGVMGRAVAKWMVQPQVRRDMAQALAKLDAFLRGTRPMAFPDLLVTPVNDAALGVALKKLRASGQPEELVERLERFLREGADVEMKHIRPLAVARKWGRDGWDILRFFLHATRSGLFEFSSETLCPNCRSTRLPRVGSLAELKGTSHCDVCQIKFDAEFDKSVELKFGVNTAVRPCEERTFCLAGPGGKPHVVSQVWLEAGETRRWSWPRIKRRMRLYSPQVKEASYLEPETQVRRIVCEPKGFVVQEGQANGGTEMVNPNGFPVLVSWQEEAWSEDILTASRVTNWQGVSRFVRERSRLAHRTGDGGLPGDIVYRFEGIDRDVQRVGRCAGVRAGAKPFRGVDGGGEGEPGPGGENDWRRSDGVLQPGG